MKRVRWGKIIFVLIIVTLFALAGYIAQRVFFVTPTLVPAQSETLIDGSPIALPALAKTPATMSDEERESAIDQARQDAMEAAKATGQNNDNVQKAGDTAAAAARKVFYPSHDNKGVGG